MTNGILPQTPNFPQYEIVGIAPNTYQLNGITYFGGNIAEVTAQVIHEQSNQPSNVDWYACDCGKVLDVGVDCNECAGDSILINRQNGYIDVIQ